MFDWLKGKPKQPSDAELVAQVAGVLHAFIRQNGLDEFSKERLRVTLWPDFRISISDAQFARGALLAVPLGELNMHVSALRSDPSLAVVGLDMAARDVVEQIPRVK